MMEIANVTQPPMVQSVSVGTTEYEYLTDMGEKFVRRINAEFVKAGARGISLVFASGDRASQLFDGKYWINFPSASPHVTAVVGSPAPLHHFHRPDQHRDLQAASINIVACRAISPA